MFHRHLWFQNYIPPADLQGSMNCGTSISKHSRKSECPSSNFWLQISNFGSPYSKAPLKRGSEDLAGCSLMEEFSIQPQHYALIMSGWILFISLNLLRLVSLSASVLVNFTFSVIGYDKNECSIIKTNTKNVTGRHEMIIYWNETGRRENKIWPAFVFCIQEV